jgi:hypothetical protein
MKETIQHGQSLAFGEHPDADQMTAFVEQALPAHEREAMLAHLVVCADCRTTVGMALPEEEIGAKTERRPWFAGWGLAWTAGAALAMTVLIAVVARHETTLRNDKRAAEQVAVAHAPETQERAAPVAVPERKLGAGVSADTRAGAGSGAAGEGGAKGQQARKQAQRGPGQGFGSATQNGGLLSAARREGDEPEEGLVRPASPAAGAPAMRALQANPSAQRAAVAGEAKGAAGGSAVGSGFVGGNGVNAGGLKKAEAVRAELTLPSGLPVLSAVAHGREVLAIDAQNGVFLSADAGEHWAAVSPNWTGRAVKAELVNYGGVNFGGGRWAIAAANASNSRPATAAPTVAAGAALEREMPRVPPPAAQPPLQSAPAAGQMAAKLTGTVTDASGAAVPGAKVTVSDAKGNPAETVVTDHDGGYLIDGLTPGAYDVKTEAPGFAQQVATAVEVGAAGPNVENMTLKVGAASQSVQVTSADAVAVRSMTNRKALTVQPAPVFAITTDSGEQWTSADGMHWKKKGKDSDQ